MVSQVSAVDYDYMGQADATARHERDLVRRCYAGLDGPAFQAEVIRSLRALLPLEAIFYATADPVTLLFTGGGAEEPLAAVTPQFMANEFGQADVNKFQSLAVGPPHVATLDQATAGDRAGSARYREIMGPLGLGDELRAALVTPAGCFGYLCLHRADSPYGFTDAEVGLIGRLTPHLAAGCRQALAGPYRAVAGPASGPIGRPGVIVLHPDLSTAAITGEAERWLAEIPGPRRAPAGLPVAVYAVALRLQQMDRDGIADGPPTVRVPSVSGGWLLVHASRLSTSTAEDIAVVVEPAHPGSVAPLLLSAHGLTPRECDVALLVLRGASTRAIGAELHLSEYTVKDYLKSIFDKTGVRSRRDLVASILGG